MSLAPRLDNIDSRVDKIDKNYIINGGMDYWQRATSGTWSKTGTDGWAGGLVADRFRSSVSRNGSDLSIAVSQQTDTPSPAFSYSLRVSSGSNVNLGATTASIATVYHPIEGVFAKDINTSDTLYLSGWVKTNVAVTDLPLVFRRFNTAGTGAESSYLTKISTTANTWTRFYKAINLVGQPIHRGTGTAFEIVIGGLSGTGFTAMTSTTDSWLTGDYWTLPTTTNWAGTSGNWIQVTGLKLSKNPHTDFSLAGGDQHTEFLLCQRYYEVQHIIGNSYLAIYTTSTGTPFFGMVMPFAVKKRTPLIGSISIVFENINGNWHWVVPGVTRYSNNNDMSGLSYLVTTDTWLMRQNRPAGNAVPTSGYCYTMEAEFNMRADAEL